MMGTDRNESLIQFLKLAKDYIDINFPNLRDATANNVQSLTVMLKATENLLNSFDRFFEEISGLPCNKELFMKCVKLRDLETEYITIIEMKLNIDRRFLEILDKFLYIATTL